MTTNSTTTIAEHVIGSLRAADYVAVTDRYAPDVLLDVNTPTWRFQLQGPSAVRQYFEEETAAVPNVRCTQLRKHCSEGAVIVESEFRFDGSEGECLWRAIDVLQIVGDEIVEHTQYCTGIWAPTDVIRQSAEAPMVRW